MAENGGEKRMDRYSRGRRSDRRSRRHAAKARKAEHNSIRESLAAQGDVAQSAKPPRGPRKWYRSPLLWISILIVLALAAGGVFLVMRARGETASSAESTVTAETGANTETAPAEIPLASSTGTIVAGMSLEEKIGQMMMVGFDGSGPSKEITSAIQDKHIGAVILFGRNISSQEQVAGMDAALQNLAVEAKQPAKLMIAIDQEGGSTRRFTDIGPYYSEPMIGEMATEAAEAAAQQQASSAARDLKKLGINTNLAPDVDVSSGWGSIMDGRAFGTETDTVVKLGVKAVRGYNNATTISCPKHFPGHGSSDGDSEKTLPTVDLDAETIQASELPPFQAVIQEGAPMIMVAHLSVPALDASGAPSSLSKPIVTDLLRKTLGFGGVIITDDLEMAAITESMSVGDAAVAAVTAGNDMVMVAQTAANQNAAYDALLAAVKSGKIKEDEINKSVTRIIDMKKKYRLEK